MGLKTKDKQKEKEIAIKALREELEEKMMEEIPEGGIRGDEIRVHVEQIDEALAGDPEQAKRIIEALLFASSKPLLVSDIRKVLKECKPAQIEKMIAELGADYKEQKRSFQIQGIAGGYEISTNSQYAPWIMKLELQKKARQTSHSALETLSILAYKQPVTRQEIEDLRGVSVSGVMATLLEKNLIKIVGRKEVPGRPFLYGTTERFLEHFGLKSLTDLPEIGEIKDMVEKAVSRDKLLPEVLGEGVQLSEEEGQATLEQAEQEAANENGSQEILTEEISDFSDSEVNETVLGTIESEAQTEAANDEEQEKNNQENE